MSIQDAWREAEAVGPKRKEAREKLVKKDDGADSQRKLIFETLAGVGVNNIEQCLMWAFGMDYGEVPMSSWPLRWNKKHINILRIDDTDNMVEVFKRIGRAYQSMVNAQYDRILRV